jgi:hypothetical protein
MPKSDGDMMVGRSLGASCRTCSAPAFLATPVPGPREVLRPNLVVEISPQNCNWLKFVPKVVKNVHPPEMELRDVFKRK